MSRSAALLFFVVALVVICLPALVVSLGRQAGRYSPGQGAGAGETEPGMEQDEKSPVEIRLYRADRQEVVSIDLEEYLVGVVMAEMPASFGMEALKAQAVAARTYALHRSRLFGGGGCPNAPEPADICNDSIHCQAWDDPRERAASVWPEEEREANLERIRQAVRETAGEVAVYRDRLIEAVYHSTCGGQTEASHAVWSGGTVPYLQSISCPYCTHSPQYRQEIEISYEKLAASLAFEPALPVASNDDPPLQVIAETPGGRVGTLKVGDTLLEGKEVRRLLELPSTAFSWEPGENGLVFAARGHGHGVGLCQYGADGMAARDKSYRQIIAYYYPGTTIARTLP